jgi:hypothetical protein
MTQARLRLHIFSWWLGFWFLTTIAAVLAPVFRRADGIGDQDVVPSILSISAVWLPPLTCFASFWFPRDNQRNAKRIRINSERTIGALSLTAAYLLTVLVLLLRPLYFASYESDGPVLSQGASLAEGLGSAVSVAALISPLALAPTIWLTGSSQLQQNK